MFMNSPQGRDYATAFAKRLPVDSPEHAVREAWRLAFGRIPTDAESAASVQFLKQQPDRHQAVVNLCQTILSMNEFVYAE